MFKKCILLLNLLAVNLFFISASKAEGLSGYFRWGYQGGLRPGLPPSDVINLPGPPQSRHIGAPDYIYLQLDKNLSKSNTITLGLQNGGNVFWNNTNFQLTNLYLQSVLNETWTLWGGVRNLVFDEIRLLDIYSPFSTGAEGFGLAYTSPYGGKGYLAFDIRKLDADIRPLKHHIVARYQHKLSDNVLIAPMVSGEYFGGMKNYTPVIADFAQGKLGFALITPLANVTTWAAWEADNPTELAPKHNQQLGISHGGQWSNDKIGLLTAFYVTYNKLATPAQEYIIENGGLLPRDYTFVHQKFESSFALQPIYRFSDHIQSALDMNLILHSHRIDTAQANAFFLTPILRYVFSEYNVSLPQFYTSLVFAFYDARVKVRDSGKPTKFLLSSQTGIEVSF